MSLTNFLFESENFLDLTTSIMQMMRTLHRSINKATTEYVIQVRMLRTWKCGNTVLMHILCSVLLFVPFCFNFLLLVVVDLNRFVIVLPSMTFNLLLLSFSLTCCNVHFRFLWRNCQTNLVLCGIAYYYIHMHGNEYARCECDIKHFCEQLRLLRYRTLSYLTRFYIPLLLFRAIFLLILLTSLYFGVS